MYEKFLNFSMMHKLNFFHIYVLHCFILIMIQNLDLDPQIYLWTLVPIFLTMFLVALIQDNLRVLFLSPSSAAASNSSMPLSKVLRNHLLSRSKRLQGACSMIPESSWKKKRAFFTNKEEGAFTELLKDYEKDSQFVKLSFSLMESWSQVGGSGMMKQYVMNMLPTILLGVFVNHFFSGFVVAKLPFPLPASFKSLIQSGIFLEGLDTCYVSSLSWYFLSLIGLRNVASLIVFDYESLRSHGLMMNQQQAEPQQSSMMTSALLGLPLNMAGPMMMGGSGGGQLPDQQILGEIENMHFVKREEKLIFESEKRLMEKLK